MKRGEDKEELVAICGSTDRVMTLLFGNLTAVVGGKTECPSRHLFCYGTLGGA